MSPVRAAPTIVAVALLPIAIGVALHGCSDQPTEPAEFQGAAAGRGKQRLTLNAGGSSVGGTLTSSRGGISCTVTVVGNTITMSGTCTKDFKTGMVLLILARPPANGGTVAWTRVRSGSD